MPSRLALAPWLAVALAACSAGTQPLDLGRGDTGPRDLGEPDAEPLPDARVLPDAEPDGGFFGHDHPIGPPDQGVPVGCAPGRTALTIPGGADHLDLAPAGDRLSYERAGVTTVVTVPRGDWVAEARGVSASFSANGRQIVVESPTRELSLVRDAEDPRPVGGADACWRSVTPNRRYVVSLVECAPSPEGATVGRLEVVDHEAQALITTTEQVVVGSVATSPSRDGLTRIALLWFPRAAPCGCAPWEAESTEFTLMAASAADAPVPPLPETYQRMRGYTPDGEDLLLAGRQCQCEPDLGAWDARSRMRVASGTLESFAPTPTIDGRSSHPFAVAPSAHGFDGVLALPSNGRNLEYTPFAGARVPVVLPGVGAGPGALLAANGRDVAALGLDDLGRVVRASVVTPPRTPEVIVPAGSFGAQRVVLSEDREEVAIVVETGGQVVISELYLGTATGRIEAVARSGSPIQTVGFLPEGRGFVAVIDGALTVFRGPVAIQLDHDSAFSSPIAADRDGCWIAHVRSNGDIRVVPVTD